MDRKNLIQIILLIFLILITYSIFNNYYKKNNTSFKSSKKIELQDADKIPSSDNKNIIENIKYTSNNNNGDIFEIFAEYGEPSIEISDLMFLTNVKANIIFKNKSNIKLTSDYANFNTKTFETTFMDNVLILREDETILGESLYLVFDQTDEKLKKKSTVDQNLIRISNNVIVKKPGYILKADILEIDLLTKNVKVFMKNKDDKVETISKLN